MNLGPVSPSVATNPLISQWLDCSEPDIIVVRMGKSELGQGISTALAQVVADALGVEVTRIHTRPPNTDFGPDEGFTAGSLSMQHSGSALAAAGNAMRQLFTAAARRSLSADDVDLADGCFSARGREVTYWDLAAEVDLHVSFDPTDVTLASTAVGTSLQRTDLAAKILGRPSYLHDLRLTDQAFGRVLRPPHRGAELSEFDAPAVSALPGVLAVVIDGSFVGVVAETEIRAREALAAASAAARWTGPATAGSSDAVRAFLTEASADIEVLTEPGQPRETTPPDSSVLRARYSRPFLAHASIGPSTAIGHVDDTGVRVWTHSQGVYPLRRDIARALGLPPEQVHVEHVEGAGCYGHNGADDVAYDAALLARAVPGRPVHVTWSREDELGWSPFGPAMVVDLEAEHSDDGTIASWAWTGYGNGHSSRPGTLSSPSLLAYASQAGGAPVPPAGDPPAAGGFGAGRNAIPGYDVGEVTATSHRLTQMPIRASALRSLGAHLNVFAIEQHMDELARRFDIDPLEYRLRHLSDPRGRAVLERVAEISDWSNPPRGDASGRGLGFARYKGKGAWCAVVVDIRAEERIQMSHMWIAVDVGRAVNPDGVVNQIEGGAIQSASWSLLEQVRFADGRVVSDTWEEYPIITFCDVPQIDVAIVDNPDEPWLGAGEASMGPTAAALGNALMDATGVRVRDLPLTPERIVAAINEAQ